jgi:hypothetical protein
MSYNVVHIPYTIEAGHFPCLLMLPCLLAGEDVRTKLHLSKGSLSDGLSKDVVTCRTGEPSGPT